LDLVRDWRNLHNRELHDLYFSPNLISDQIKKGGGEQGMWHVQDRRDRHTRFGGETATDTTWRN